MKLKPTTLRVVLRDESVTPHKTRSFTVYEADMDELFELLRNAVANVEIDDADALSRRAAGEPAADDATDKPNGNDNADAA